MEELKAFYESNSDFRNYVGKYMNKNSLKDIDTALTHSCVLEYYKYLKEQESLNRSYPQKESQTNVASVYKIDCGC